MTTAGRCRFWLSALAATLALQSGLSAAAQEHRSVPDQSVERTTPAPFQTTFAGAGVNLPMRTMRARRFARVVRQERDFSCGSAALATLLSYHYRTPLTEAEVFAAMWASGDQALIRERGFSLLDMKTYLAARGLLGDGYKLTLDKLAETGVPAIALIDWRGYKHFVVVKGIGPERVLLGDPSAGLVARSRAAFERSWDGTVFLIRSRPETGRAHFNLAMDWEAEPSGPVRAKPGFRDAGTDTLVRTLPVDSAFSLFRGF